MRDRDWARSANLSRQGRLSRREVLRLMQAAAGATTLAALLTACERAARAPAEDGATAPAPPYPPPMGPCRPDPLRHVYEPARLTLLAACVSVSGTVNKVAFSPRDGNTKLLVEPDAPYRPLLAPSNEGLLIVEVIPPDEPSVFIPEVGQHATFHGALSLDSGRNRQVAIHPAWLITTELVTGPLSPRPVLDVTLDLPEAVAVGEQVSVAITVTSSSSGSARPVSQVHLFLELSSSEGGAMRWEAAQTNRLGKADVNLATLIPAGDYTLAVYAAKRQETGQAQAALRIRRR